MNIITSTNRSVDPTREILTIEEIAHSLSNQCRFTGHCKEFYSIAQHSVLVALQCKWPEAGLMHDAAEATMHDISRPLKYKWWMFPYRVMERALQNEINDCYNIHPDMLLDVKEADNTVVKVEIWHLFDTPMAYPGAINYGKHKRFTPWPPAKAKAEFIALATELGLNL